MPSNTRYNFDTFVANVEKLKLLSTGNVPIHYKSYATVVGFAIVDEKFLPLVTSIGPWYLADVREPSCPRISFYLPGYGKKLLPLNRLMATVFTMMRKENTQTIPTLTREQAWLKCQELQIPQIRFRSQNVYDCRFENLLVSYIISGAPNEELNRPELDPVGVTDPVDSDFEAFFAQKKNEPLPSNSSEIVAPKGSEFANDLTDLLREESTDNSRIVKGVELK